MKKMIRTIAGVLLLTMLFSLVPVMPVMGATGTSSTAEATGQGIKIMTYNVMDDVAPNEDGTFSYDSPANREDAIAVMLKEYLPDVIGMQEAGDGGYSGILDWCAALNEDLKDIYAYRSLTDETGLKMDICRGLIIFYRKDRFTLLESGAQGYSQPANNKRCFQWVKLRDNENGVEFYVFNTHWTVDGKITLEENEAIRTVEMQELANKVNTLAKDQHVFLTGDFNSFYIPKNSMGDAVNITRLQENTGLVDALLSTEDMCSINAKGTVTPLTADDVNIMKSADHVVYPTEFYSTVKLERILSRTYSPKLSDHDAFLVHFNYKRPTLTATAASGEPDAYYSNGAYYIDYMTKGTKDIPITVEIPKGAVYTDAACTKSAGTELTIKNAASNTYMGKNTYYIKFGSEVYPLYLRACNSNPMEKAMFVDPSLQDKAPGTTGLYCDKWYCRVVTVGVNGFATIQEAVDAAKDGYRVMVAPGTYREDVTYTGKSIDFYGSNRNSSKALVVKDGQLTVNPNRTFETYLSGSISFAFGDLQTGSLMVNGFHFIDSTATGQIRITGGNYKKTVDLRICNNLFNCYTDGAVNNGSAIHMNTAIQKTGTIEDNYFHLTETPTYTDSAGATVNYTNRAITMRNMRDMTIHGNYFDGYTGNKIRPFWLSSEVSSESTVAGYGNLAFTGNRLENSTSASIYINNIRDNTYANLLIADNTYGGEKMVVDFRDTSKQTSQNLPTDKSKVTFSVQTGDLPNLTILPATNSGITTEEFTSYVTFRNDKGDVIFAHAVVEGNKVTYTGVEPWKEASDTMHYTFKQWVDADGNLVDLNNITDTMDIYAAYTETKHTLVLSGDSDPACTVDGYTGDKTCTVCSYVVEGKVIPATGHAVITEAGYAPTCTEPGLTDAAHCDTCKAILAVHETISPLGHAYKGEVTLAPTLTSEGVRVVTCENDPTHTYEEKAEVLSKSLHFTFDNGTAALERYNNHVYNFRSFDDLSAWRGRTQGYQEGSATMDPEAGTLTVMPGVTGFTSIFADSVNYDLNYDPQYAQVFQVRFKAKNLTGSNCKVGIYFYYSTDNSYVAGGSVAVSTEELSGGDYILVTGKLTDKVRQLDEVNRILFYLSGLNATEDLSGEMTLDYIYVGPTEDLPTVFYTVTFTDEQGNVLEIQKVNKGEIPTYTGSVPQKDPDATYHYTFKGWDKALSPVTADTAFTATYEKVEHSYTYISTDAGNHVGTCSCGYTLTGAHSCSFEIAKEPTVSTAGALKGICTHCNDTLTVPLPKLNDTDYTVERVAPTCTAEGKDTYTWNAVAYGTYSFAVKQPAMGHSYDAGVVTTAPTFTAAGVKTFTCSNDPAHSYTEDLGTLSKSLYFTFDNSSEDRERYNNYVYNFRSFDDISPWRGRTQGYKEGSAVMDTAAGTLTIMPGVTGFGSIFADSVNFDLNFDPEHAEYYQIRFKAEGFTGKACKVGMYFYYSTDNSYVAATSVPFTAEVLEGNDYFVATGVIADRVRNLDEVNRIVVYISGFDAPTDLNGKFILDYVYAGPYETLPTPVVEEKDPVQETSWKLGHTLNLASDISVNLAVSKSLLTGFDMETVYVLAEVDTYNGNTKTGVKTVKLLPTEQGNYYYFTLTGLTAVNMNDRIRSVLYGTKDGQVYYSATDDYSITDYAYSQMNKANMPQSLKILCADLLRYGAKAQIFKSYRLDSLADSNMTDAHKANLSDISTITFGNTNMVLNDLSSATVTWAGKALDLNSKVILKFIFSPANYKGKVEDLTLRLTFVGIDGTTKTVTLEKAEVYNAERNYYAFSFDGLLAAELRTVVSARVYDGNTPVSATLQYSADTYGNNKTGALGDLCRALFAYSDSAKQYFQS